MILLGNDVVDLSSPLSVGKAGDDRFVKKVLTLTEQAFLRESGQPDTDLWQFWSAKEAAYKALSRHQPDISFSPAKYMVTWEQAKDPNKRLGIVHTPAGILPVLCRSDPDKAWSLCLLASCSPLVNLAFDSLPRDALFDHGETKGTQSHAVRSLAARSLSSALNCPKTDITISSPGNGIPQVLFKGRPSGIILSLSHDGPFLFSAWCADARLKRLPDLLDVFNASHDNQGHAFGDGA
jgi:phosphopantetheinyl transferase (holo-ACP synthase)